MNLIRENTYSNKIVFIDGCGGSGKILIASILECLENTEKRIEDEELLLMSTYYRNNKLSEDAMISFIKTHIDRRIHYLMIARQLNMKVGEAMSIFKYPYPLKYLKRYFIKDRKRGNEICAKYNPIFLNATQNAIPSYDIYKKAFGDRLYLIYILRNPIDLIYDMYKRKFINDIGTCVSNTIQTIEVNGNIVPIFAKDWYMEYISMKDIDRVIRWLHDIYINDMESYDIYKNKGILLIDFDYLVTNPHNIIKEIETLLNSKMTLKLNRILKREKCPRKIDYEFRKNEEEYIKNVCSDDSLELINDMVKIYENFSNNTRKKRI